MSKKLPITSSKAVKITKTAKSAKKPTVRVPAVSDDFKSAALVISVLMNLVVLVGWAVLTLNDSYVVPVVNFFFN